RAERAGRAPCIKVLDFGIAKIKQIGAVEADLASGSAATEPHLTATQEMLGTPHYMSPEQIKSTRDVDARTDIWSLGVILYGLLTGRLPFEAPHLAAVLAAVLYDSPAPPSDLRSDCPPELATAILRCLEKEPSKRFQS